MAASGFMNDFARMPTQRKVAVFAFIGLALLGLYWQFIYKGLKADLEQTEQDSEVLAAQNKKLTDDIPEFEKLKTKLNELDVKIAENQKALPTEAEVPAFFETLERKVTESGVEINKWRKLTEEPVEKFVKVPVEIEINGTFMQIKRFFASLVQKGVAPIVPGNGEPPPEERERIVSIENLSLTNPIVKNREINLTAKFIAVTFRQEDKNEPAGKPVKPVAPKPTPPANTPAGAKARTEDAIDKDDKKDRNATGVDEAKTPAATKKLEGGI